MTRYVILARLKDDTKTAGFSRFSFSRMSFLVSLSAVAVRAITGTPGNSFFNPASIRYSGLKSCPQCEIQWASSIAIKETGRDFRKLISLLSLLNNRSGAKYNNFIWLFLSLVVISICSCDDWLEL